MHGNAARDDDGWRRAVDARQLLDAGRLTVRLGSKQIALFQFGQQVLACNNRCPHEGYPLVEGALGDECVLTCHWHNWKFDLRSGANLYGGDALRVYPVRVVEGKVWVDVRDPSPAQRVATLLADLDTAMDDDDYTRIAREGARLEQAGASAEAIVAHAIARSHTRLRYGMTHAYAAAEVWLRLRDELADEAERLTCLIEALAHIAFDTLREPDHAFAAQPEAWQEAGFLAAVEAQDESLATGYVLGALAQDLAWPELEASLCRAALAHYSDFGHSLIYLMHLTALVERLGPAVRRPLLLAWLRSLIFATREDLLPDFRAYAPALAAWPAAAESSPAMPEVEPFVGHTVRQTLQTTLDAAREHSPLALHQALLAAAAEHLLRFDVWHEQRSDNPATDNVGWLDFTHAITFAHAVRHQCLRVPELWPQGLLQVALFVGRNSAYLRPTAGPPSSAVEVSTFDRACIARLLDHGLQPSILAAHLLKTWDAARSESAAGASPAVQARLQGAVTRLFEVTLKQRHPLRVARQALRFVSKES